MAPILLALASLAALAGCGGGRTVPRVSEQEFDERVEALTRQDDQTLYWAGRTVAGLPLTDAVATGSGRASFFYGTCELPEGEGGCAVPLEIQQFPFVRRDWRNAAGCMRRPPVRGVPAVHHDTLVLFTKARVVKIYAAQPRRIALALRALQGGLPSAPLPQPSPAIASEVARACR